MIFRSKAASGAFCVVMALATGPAKGAVIGGIDDQLNAADAFGNFFTLTLPKFNSALGTLNSVTIYYRARVDYSNISIQNNDPTPFTSDASVHATVVRNFANSANGSDIYPTSQPLQIFDTGLPGAGLGNCSSPPAFRISNPGCGVPLNVAGFSTANFGPFSALNTDAVYGLTTATGLYGLLGVTLTGTNIASYIGSGTFTLTGRTGGFASYDIDGGSLTISQTATRGVAAEVNYDYTPAAPVPEPATMGLMGSALVSTFFLRKRLKT
jgi:hypothetical protein